MNEPNAPSARWNPDKNQIFSFKLIFVVIFAYQNENDNNEFQDYRQQNCTGK